MSNVKNAVIFVRVSKRDMDYQRQIFDLQAIAQTKGYAIVETITEKISGAKKNNERPQIKRLFDLASSGAVHTVFTTEVTRLGRNTREVINVVEDLTEKGISIYIHNFGIETLHNGKRNSIAQILITLMAEFGRLEREFLIERTKSGLDNARRAGKTLGRPVGSTKNVDAILKEYPSVIKSLRKGFSVREAAKINDLAINTVMKVKRALAGG